MPFGAAVKTSDFGGARPLVVRHFDFDGVAKERTLVVFGYGSLSGLEVIEALHVPNRHTRQRGMSCCATRKGIEKRNQENQHGYMGAHECMLGSPEVIVEARQHGAKASANVLNTSSSRGFSHGQARGHKQQARHQGERAEKVAYDKTIAFFKVDAGDIADLSKAVHEVGFLSVGGEAGNEDLELIAWRRAAVSASTSLLLLMLLLLMMVVLWWGRVVVMMGMRGTVATCVALGRAVGWVLLLLCRRRRESVFSHVRICTGGAAVVVCEGGIV